jgi:DNA-binding transcriptional ArsR family regulator
MIDAQGLERNSERGSGAAERHGKPETDSHPVQSRQRRDAGRRLAEKVDLSQSALSQHLAKLRNQGLVVTRREAQTIYYSINSKPVLHVLKTLDTLYCN